MQLASWTMGSHLASILVLVATELLSLPAAGDEILRIESARCAMGDKAEWSGVDFDDSAWEKVAVPGGWYQLGIGDPQSMGWYRFRIDVPADWEGRALSFSPGVVSNSHEIFWNGVKIAEEGGIDPLIDLPKTDTFVVVKVPPQAIRFGEKNVIALRVRSYWGDGGIVGATPSLGSREQLQAQKNDIESWQLIVISSLLSVQVMLILLGAGLAIWQWRESLAWIYVGLLATQVIPELLRVAAIFSGGSWLNQSILLADLILYLPIGMVFGFHFLARVVQNKTAIWVWWINGLTFVVLSTYVLLIVLRPERYHSYWFQVMAWLWFIPFLIGSAYLVMQAMRRDWQKMLPLVIVAVFSVALFGLEAFNHSGILQLGQHAPWIDPWGVVWILFSVAFGYLLVCRLHEQRLESQQLAQRVLTSEIEERSRIARELHDGIAQTLIAMKLDLETKFSEGEEDIGEVIQQLDSVSDEVRDTAHGLHPSILGSRSLGDAFRTHAAMIGPNPVELKIERAGDVGLSLDTRHHVFRIFQELLGNAVQHSPTGESPIQVKWFAEGKTLVLELVNEIGGDVTALSEGLGTKTLRERAALIDGEIKTRYDGRTFRVSLQLDLGKRK